jgi:hypothetical protein
VARATLVRTMPHSRDKWQMLAAILGTTISQYLFSWQAGQEVEKKRMQARARLLCGEGQQWWNLT